MLVEELQPHIREIILATPSEQLGTITAREVRAQLVATVEGVDKDWVKENKTAINELIGSVFESLVPPAEDAGGSGGGDNVKAEDDDDDGDANDAGGDGGPSTPPPPRKRGGGSKPKAAKAASKSKRELTDEEYARQLSAELNGHASRSSRSGKAAASSRGGGGNNARKGASRTPKKAKKSAERVDDSDASDDGDGYGGGGGGGEDGRKRAAKPKKGKRAAAGGGSAGGGGGGGAKGGFMKEYLLSVPLSALLEVDRLSRPQVVKQLWAYIKDHELQNPSNKREILCDDRLRLVFSSDKIDMFKMNKVLGQHLHEEE